MKKIQDKREQEKQTVYKMIQIYCHHQHKTSKLCNSCQQLYDYAVKRIDVCPFMETKTFCSNCKVHCYQKEMQEQIRMVMRYSGPRMLFHNPIMAIQHVLLSRKERNK